jgi:hypothetical protein
MRTGRLIVSTSFACLLVAAGCGGPAPGDTAAPNLTDDSTDDDLPIGERPEDDKADGEWGDALKCKDVPQLPALVDPRITISLSGLTLHVVDVATGYDKVFPIGAGQIEDDETQASYGESLSYYPIVATGQNDFSLSPRTVNPCRTWWTDPDTQEKSPVFAGMPFMPFYGPYAIHGPIDNYRAKNGGSLRRGYVSHGCIRMQSADVLELYGRIKTLERVPVRLQREPERLANGGRVDLASRWVGAECGADADCNYAGGICLKNPYGGRGFCSATCTRTCADRAGAPSTFCVADPSQPTRGICVNKVNAQNPDCRAYGQMAARTSTRFGQATVSAQVCMPASRGSIGDPCLAEGECRNGAICAGLGSVPVGTCSRTCVTACPDEPGFPMTACANQPVSGSTVARGCARSCTPQSNASECEGGESCVRRNASDPRDRRFICKR